MHRSKFTKTKPKERTILLIKFYFTTSCNSCCKGRYWLEHHNLRFEEINVVTNPPSRDDLLHMFYLSDDGPEALISKRCVAYKQLGIDTSRLTLNELVEFIQANPQVLRRPLVVDQTHLQIGFNEDDICQFLPRNIRQAKLSLALAAIDTFAKTLSADELADEIAYLKN